MRTSHAPKLTSVELGRSSTQSGSPSEVIVRESEWLISHVRKIASVPSVTMIEGTRA